MITMRCLIRGLLEFDAATLDYMQTMKLTLIIFYHNAQYFLQLMLQLRILPLCSLPGGARRIGTAPRGRKWREPDG